MDTLLLACSFSFSELRLSTVPSAVYAYIALRLVMKAGRWRCVAWLKVVAVDDSFAIQWEEKRVK